MTRWAITALLVVHALGTAAEKDHRLPPVQKLTIERAAIRLVDQRSRQQLVVTAHGSDGYLYDVTREAKFESADAAIAQVDASGVVRPRKAGTTQVRVKGFERTAEVTVTVDDQAKAPPVSYTNEIMAVLGKSGCNAGACHGHNSGKGGFKLSLRGYNPNADLEVLKQRIDRTDVEQSLILLKPTGQASHRGGKRFPVGSDSYRILRQWLAEGVTSDVGRAAKLQRIEVLPESRLMPRPEMRQQLIVRAHFADGVVRDITDQAIYELSAEGIVEVGPDGVVTGKREGEAAILVRFLGHMAISRFLVIQHKPDFQWTEPPVNNFIDKHIHAKLKTIQVRPSELSSDAEFLRRVYLDTTGLVPTPAEGRSFLADKRADKRARLIDDLLDREEFGDTWAAYWIELSGTNQSGDSAGQKGMWTQLFWLRHTINRNVPYDQFVKTLVAGKGRSLENPAVTFSAHRLPRAEVVPQLFLGVRLECAQCHDHPFDTWKQSDYHSLQAFFTDLASKEGPGDPGGREMRTFVAPEKYLPWEQGKKTALRLPDGRTVEVSVQRNRREVLAEWLFDSAKKPTARALVNRVWGRLLGRGIVEPVDDMRFSNPPVNESLLDALADDFIAHRYDFKHLVRTILNSRTYQLSSISNPSNEREVMNFSHARLRRLSAEQLLDCVGQVTGVDEPSRHGAPGIRSVQIPLTLAGERFLAMFGRPEQRMSACECIRSPEITLPQVLHLLNGDTIGKKLRAEGSTLQHLLAGKLDDARLVDEVYLAVLSRFPNERERGFGKRYLSESADGGEAAEDLMWALITSQEFLFNH